MVFVRTRAHSRGLPHRLLLLRELLCVERLTLREELERDDGRLELELRDIDGRLLLREVVLLLTLRDRLGLLELRDALDGLLLRDGAVTPRDDVDGLLLREGAMRTMEGGLLEPLTLRDELDDEGRGVELERTTVREEGEGAVLRVEDERLLVDGLERTLVRLDMDRVGVRAGGVTVEELRAGLREDGLLDVLEVRGAVRVVRSGVLGLVRDAEGWGELTRDGAVTPREGVGVTSVREVDEELRTFRGGLVVCVWLLRAGVRSAVERAGAESRRGVWPSEPDVVRVLLRLGEVRTGVRATRLGGASLALDDSEVRTVAALSGRPESCVPRNVRAADEAPVLDQSSEAREARIVLCSTRTPRTRATRSVSTEAVRTRRSPVLPTTAKELRPAACSSRRTRSGAGALPAIAMAGPRMVRVGA